MFKTTFSVAGICALVLVGCASQPDPIRAIYPQPTFDKYGGGGGGACPEGTSRGPNGIPGTAAQPGGQDGPCCPEGYQGSQDGEICVPIPPTYRQGEGDDDRNGGRSPNDPTGALQ